MTVFRGSTPLTSDWKHFQLDVADGIGVLAFQRAERLNALTFEVYADLRDLLRELPRHEEIRVLVITGEGKGFCSGGDVDGIIGELLRFDARDLLEFTRMTGAVIQNMRECPVPIVAAVNGVAAGAGAVISLAADLRILSTEARFRFLFTNVGLSGGDMGSAYLLPRLIGLGRATELLLFGDPVLPEQALAIGLAHRVVPGASLMEAAMQVARRLAGGPGFAYAATKLLLSREQDMDLAGSLELEATTQALLMKSADFAEFHAAFREGREARWSGR